MKFKSEMLQDKRVRESDLRSSRYKRLVELFKKYNVSYANEFYIDRWNKTDQIEFIKLSQYDGYSFNSTMKHVKNTKAFMYKLKIK